jgi:hypothetical protein
MKKTILFLSILFTACSGGHQDYKTAENAFDAGREFINACQQGDFVKAAFYMSVGEKNTEKLKETEKQYREKDRDGRQQLRSASLNIHEVKDLNDTTTMIYYSYSFDNKPQVLEVVKQNGNWLVNFSFQAPGGN